MLKRAYKNISNQPPCYKQWEPGKLCLDCPEPWWVECQRAWKEEKDMSFTGETNPLPFCAKCGKQHANTTAGCTNASYVRVPEFENDPPPKAVTITTCSECVENKQLKAEVERLKTENEGLYILAAAMCCSCEGCSDPQELTTSCTHFCVSPYNPANQPKGGDV
jgi:hypothetical protein